MSRLLFDANGWRDLGDKAGPALEGYIAPQPIYGDNDTIPDANQKVDVRCAPKHPANEARELDVTEFYDSGASADRRQNSLIPIAKWRQ